MHQDEAEERLTSQEAGQREEQDRPGQAITEGHGRAADLLPESIAREQVIGRRLELPREPRHLLLGPDEPDMGHSQADREEEQAEERPRPQQACSWIAASLRQAGIRRSLQGERGEHYDARPLVKWGDSLSERRA